MTGLVKFGVMVRTVEDCGGMHDVVEPEPPVILFEIRSFFEGIITRHPLYSPTTVIKIDG